MLTLRDLLTGLGIHIDQSVAFLDRPLAHITQDSREIQPGSLFVARRGETLDGHDFIADAVSRGAKVILAEHSVEVPQPVWILDARQSELSVIASSPGTDAVIFVLVTDSQEALERVAAWWRACLPVEVIGVTGSVGKTSTKELIASVLGKRFRVLKSERSLNTDVGMALTLLQLTAEHEKAVLEMGMYAKGEIAHLCKLSRPRYGVVTNVGPTHLERLGSIEAIAEAKAELVEALPTDGVAILNRDDPLVWAMAGRTSARVFSYGLKPEADLWANDLESHGLEGIRFRLHYAGESIYIRAPLLGMHSVQTALAATAVGLLLGLTWDEIASGLGQVPKQLRLIVVPGANGCTIVDDSYNASPASCLAALNLLAELNGRRIAVLGDMLELGKYEEEGHRLVGRRVMEVAQILVAVGPRGRIIGEEARSLGMGEDSVFFAKTNDEAIDILKRLTRPGDFVLIKGSRGMHMEDIVRGIQ